jgi:hypothetical protein
VLKVLEVVGKSFLETKPVLVPCAGRVPIGAALRIERRTSVGSSRACGIFAMSDAARRAARSRLLAAGGFSCPNVAAEMRNLDEWGGRLRSPPSAVMFDWSSA